MRERYVFKFLVVVLTSVYYLCGQQTSDKNDITAAQALGVFQERFNDVLETAQVLFNPVSAQSQTPVGNPYPLSSINEKNIDTLFGPTGLNVDARLLVYIKNFYFYLEYITKLELAARIAGYARQKNIDVTSTLESSSWKGLIDKMIPLAGSWAALINASRTVSPDWLEIKGSISASSWQELSKTSFWQNIPITADLIINSTFWQEYLKYVITNSFKQDSSLLKAITDMEKTIFRFIPNIEVAYYNDDFTQLRNSSEFSRLHLILSQDVRTRALIACYDWQLFVDKKTGAVDLLKTYSAVAEYKNSSDFYRVVALTETTDLGTLAEQILTKKIPLDPSVLQKPLLQEKLLCLAMIKNLQAQTYYLFDKDHIKKTMDVLGKNGTYPNPSFILYHNEDSIYLEDLASLLEGFKQQAVQSSSLPNKSLTLSGKGNEKVVVQDFGSWLSDSWGDVKKTARDAWQGVQDAGKTALDEAMAVGLGGAGGIISAVDPQTGQSLIDASKELQEKVAQDISDTIADAQKVITDTETLAKDATKGAAAIVGKAFAKITGDKKLGSDVEGALDSLADVVISFYAGISHVTVASVGGLVKLSVDAVNLASTIISDAVVAIKTGEWQALGDDALKSLNNLAYDIVSSLLSVTSFVVQTFVNQLKALIKFAGYLVSMITDLTLDISKGIFNTLGSVFDIFGWQAGEDAMQSANQWMSTHRRLIETTVTTGLLLVAVVATDGAALPLIAMTIGPQLFQEYGSYQNDERAAQKLAEEKKFINDYQTFVSNNKIIAQNTQHAWSNELHKKYDAQAVNMQRDLGFYQNFTQEYLINSEEQLSYYLGQYLTPLLTPDENGLMFADVGSLYGFKTGVLNFNPSQGFPLYCEARDAFSQEIAVYPALAISDGNENVVSAKAPRKFWFNQKETMLLHSPAREVEIMWQALYTLNQWYIGLYFGGQTLDFDAIKKTGSAPIAVSNLAKMVVYTKQDKDAPISLQLYEHEGAGWFKQPVNGPAFVVGAWYHMNMQLEGTTLTVQVWKDGEQKPAGQQFTVMPTEQKTLGIISAGASIEYKVIKPAQAVQKVEAVRKPLPLVFEKDREVAARKNRAQLTNPKIGTFSLQAFGMQQIMKGHYIYTTNATNLRNAKNEVIQDYIVLAQSSVDRITNQYRITDIGISPQDSPAAFVSLITNKAYDQSGTYLTVCQNVFDIYKTKFGPLSDTLSSAVENLKNMYAETLSGPFVFGSLKLGLSKSMARNAQFIYSALSLAPELRDKQGNAVKNNKGEILYDYFVVITTDTRGNELMGNPFDANTTRVRSLVTGNEYGQASAEPVEKGHRVTESLQVFQQSFGALPADVLQALTNSRDYYQAQVKVEEDSNATVPNTVPNQQTTTSDTSSHDNVSTSTTVPLIPLQPPSGQDQSIQQRTESAAAQEESWGG